MKEYAYKDLIDKNIIPDDCEILYCSGCDLDKLPVLPDGLTTLFCRNNNIIELPELPNGLKILFCNDNPIKFITPNMYSIMKRIYLIDETNVIIHNTIFYDNSGCSSESEFFGCEE